MLQHGSYDVRCVKRVQPSGGALKPRLLQAAQAALQGRVCKQMVMCQSTQVPVCTEVLTRVYYFGVLLCSTPRHMGSGAAPTRPSISEGVLTAAISYSPSLRSRSELKTQPRAGPDAHQLKEALVRDQLHYQQRKEANLQHTILLSLIKWQLLISCALWHTLLAHKTIHPA